jgi:hypothetical protein
MTSKTTIAMTLVAALCAPAVHAEWRGNEPCSGKEGVIGSCLNRISPRDREPVGRPTGERSVYSPPAASAGTSAQGPRTASNLR